MRRHVRPPAVIEIPKPIAEDWYAHESVAKEFDLGVVKRMKRGRGKLRQKKEPYKPRPDPTPRVT